MSVAKFALVIIYHNALLQKEENMEFIVKNLFFSNVYEWEYLKK